MNTLAHDVTTMAQTKRQTVKGSKDMNIASIALPLPNQFSDSQQHSWSQEQGVVGNFGSKLTGTSVLGVSMDKILGETSRLTGTRKPLFDPSYYQNYTGSAPRTFTAKWEFVPQSGDDTNRIVQIIMKLKQYTSPTRMVKGVAILAPYYFEILFSNKYITAMIGIGRVVCENIEVDYGDGQMQTYSDGMPKKISLTLTLKEVDMAVSQDYGVIPSGPPGAS